MFRWRLLNLLALSASATICLAQVPQTYSEFHAFEVTPNSNVTPQITIKHFEHAWATENGPDDSQSQVKPMGQPPGFNNFGKDRASRNSGRIKNAHKTVVNQELVSVDPLTGTPNGFTSSALAVCALGTKGQANTFVNINPVGADHKVSGTINCSGETLPKKNPPERSNAYAFSYATVELKGGKQMRSGKIKWSPTINVGRVAGAGIAKGKTRAIDPISVDVVDIDTGETYHYHLLSIELTAEESGLVWAGNTLTFSLTNGKFMIDMPGDKTTLGGKLWIEASAGHITKCESSGIFSGINRPLGSISNFVTTMPNLDFDYDLGDFDGHDLDVTINLGGGGELKEQLGLHGHIDLQDYLLAGDRLEVYFDPAYIISVVPGLAPATDFEVEVDPFGDYSIDTDFMGSEGIYCKSSHFLRRAATVPLPDSDGNSRVDFQLINGDVDGDNWVTIFDYSILATAFDTTPGDADWDPRADLDGDGIISIFDYSILATSFDVAGD